MIEKVEKGREIENFDGTDIDIGLRDEAWQTYDE